MASGYEIVQTLNKKRLPKQFENLGYNRTFLNGKYTLSLHLFLLWLRSYGLVGDKNIAMLDNSVCMYEYVTNTVCLCKLLFVSRLRCSSLPRALQSNYYVPCISGYSKHCMYTKHILN